jgi:hypothetical protein
VYTARLWEGMGACGARGMPISGVRAAGPAAAGSQLFPPSWVVRFEDTLRVGGFRLHFTLHFFVIIAMRGPEISNLVCLLSSIGMTQRDRAQD